MRAHHAIIRALAEVHRADLVRAFERERAAARAHVRKREQVARLFGPSLRLRDGRWIHLRHDSA